MEEGFAKKHVVIHLLLSYTIPYMDKNFIKKIHESHKNAGHSILSQHRSERFISKLLGLLFPHFSERKYHNQAEVELQMEVLTSEMSRILEPYCEKMQHNCQQMAALFFAELEGIYEKLLLDAEAIMTMDPAARSTDEVISAYPGFYAIAVYRLANWLFKKDVPLMPRVLTEYAHKLTGVDIHPGASIGKNFSIDHGTGIVIGETTMISDNVRIYQGVTLGGLVVNKEDKGSKRHPTIEENVTIYANASILGGKTIIGANSIIGGNVWLTESVPAGSRVYYKGEVRVKNSE